MKGFWRKATFASILFLCLACSQSVFAQWKDAEPEWYLPTGDGCSLFVQEFGHGPETIVVLHGGWGAEHSYLLDPFKGLEEKYHLVFYDQRGSLLSPCPAEKITVQKHVDDLERLRAALGLEKLNLVGHSMGTFLAMDYLQQHPDRVKGLVLVGALPPRTPKTDAEKQLLQQQQNASQQFMSRPEIAAELHQLGLDKDEKNLTPKQSTNAWHVRFAGVNIFHVDRWREVRGGRAFYNADAGQAAANTMPHEWDFTAAIAARHCSTRVINGDHDFADPAARSWREATTGIPNVQIVVLKGAGHVSWIDAPDEFAKSLGNALESTTQCR